MKELPVQQQIEEGGGEVFHTKYFPDRTLEVTPNIVGRINIIRGSVQPLPEYVRAFLEPRFGYNYRHVRVHTDAQAAESARVVNARAFTVGQDVVFGAEVDGA